MLLITKHTFPSGRKINFIVIPENIESKFENKGFCVIRESDSTILTEFSEQFLAGEVNARSRLLEFTKEFHFNQFSIEEISTIAKGVSTYENLDKTIDLKLLITLSNIIAKYSPDEEKGISAKEKVVKRIAILTEKTDEKNIYLLRNLQSSAK